MGIFSINAIDNKRQNELYTKRYPIRYFKKNGMSKAVNRLIVLVKQSIVSGVNGIVCMQDRPRDVLYIDGYGIAAPALRRYRVLHPMEQLRKAGVSCCQVYHKSLKTNLVSKFQTFVIYRTPITPQVDAFIKEAHLRGKKCVFDTDDLVMSDEYIDMMDRIHTLSEEDRADVGALNNRIGSTLQMSDAATTTTEALAKELKRYVNKVFINRNVASDSMVALSEKAIRQKRMHTDERIIIAYFSGSATHRADFDVVVPALLKILENSNVELWIVGELDIPYALTVFSERVKKKKMVSWKKLPSLIAQVDINIAPLVDNLFNAAKSEIKWMEAALVKAPTIASDIGAFHAAIVPGETGFLCGTSEEWISTLHALIHSRSLRERVGQAAYEEVHHSYTTANHGNELAAFLLSDNPYDVV